MYIVYTIKIIISKITIKKKDRSSFMPNVDYNLCSYVVFIIVGNICEINFIPNCFVFGKESFCA